MLPSVDPLPSPPQNDINDPTYQFHIWYAPRAQGTSYLLNFFVTIAVLSACDIVWGSRRTVPHHVTSRAFVVKVCIMICKTLKLNLNSTHRLIIIHTFQCYSCRI